MSLPKGWHELKIMSFYEQSLDALRKYWRRNKVPAACPQCGRYEYLTQPDVNEAFRDAIVPFNDIVCENCGWIGEADQLGDVESNGD